MATGIDHVVIAVNDLDQAIRNYTAAGFTVTPGGEHANGETHNALIAFTDGSYFEIIAWKAKKPQETVWLQRLRQGEGLVDFALRTVDLTTDVERLRAEGMDVPDPQPGGRTRPDGERVEWQTLRFDPAQHPSLPFFCHSTNDRSLRVPSGTAAQHENDVTGIDTVFVAVADIEKSAADYQAISGIAFEHVEHDQPTSNQWKRFRIGTVSVVLVHPGEADSELAELIRTRGEVPFEITLRSTADEGSPIDASLTHGARLAIYGRN